MSRRPVRTRVSPSNRGSNLDNYRVFKGSVVDGTLIRTDAKVGNVKSHLKYASTLETPYMTSTSSRYNALKRMRRPITDDMINFFQKDAKIELAMKALAEEIRVEETKNLERFHKILAPNSPLSGEAAAKEVVDIMNSAYRDGKTLENILEQTVGEMVKAYYRFLDGQMSRNVEDELVEMIMSEDTVTKSLKEREDIAYRDNFDHKEFFSNFNLLLDILSEAEIGVSRASDIARPVSYMARVLARSKGKEAGGGLNQEEFNTLHEKFRKIQTNLERQIDSEVKMSRAQFSQGQLAEMVMAAGMMEIANNHAKLSQQINKDMSKTVKDINNELPDFVAEILQDGSAKTKDFSISAKGQTITVDAKQMGYKRIKDAGGKLYETTMSVDLGEIFRDNIINSNKGDRAVQMYRIMVLNLAAHGEYHLTFKERQILLQKALADKSFFDKKFYSDSGDSRGYPDLVNLNGELFRFSDIVEKMGDKDFRSKTSGSTLVGSQNTSYDPRELYAQKIREGRMERVRGFSEKLTSPINMASLVQAIEGNYFSSSNPRVKFTFKV